MGHNKAKCKRDNFILVTKLSFQRVKGGYFVRKVDKTSLVLDNMQRQIGQKWV